MSSGREAGDELAARWSVWHALAFVAGLHALVKLARAGGRATGRAFALEPTDEGTLFVSLALVCAANLLVLAIARHVARRGASAGGAPPTLRAAVGWTWPVSWRNGVATDYVQAIVWIVFGGTVWGLVRTLNEWYQFAGPRSADDFTHSTALVLAALVAHTVLVGPLVEEVIYRGIAYPAVAAALERRLGSRVAASVGAVFLTSIAFAAVHVSQYRGAAGVDYGALAGVFASGAAFGSARAITGSVLPGFAMHATGNALSALLRVLGRA